MDKSKSLKIAIAVIFFVAAAVALAYQFGLLGGSKPKVDFTNTDRPLQGEFRDGQIVIEAPPKP